MFARASKRTLYPDGYKQFSSSLELLPLPFLCPALYGHTISPRKDSRIIRPTSSTSHLRRSCTGSGRNPASRTPSNRRRLASAAAAAIGYQSEYDSYIPWAEPPAVTSLNNEPRFDRAGISSLDHSDPDTTTSLLIIKDPLARYPKKFRAKNSITGDLNELHQNLHACLQVGRLERAAALLRRLNEIYTPDAAGLLAAHSDYLREVADEVAQTQNQRLLKDLQKWFEVDVMGAGVNPNAEMYTQMIRASSYMLDASKERAMRRYQKMADDAGLASETRALWEFYVDDASLTTDSHLHELADTESTEMTQSIGNEPGAAGRVFAESVDEIPAVKPTEQKGVGLVTLRKSLELFEYKGVDLLAGRRTADGDLSAEERQRLLEVNTFDAAMVRWRQDHEKLKGIGVNSKLASTPIGSMMWKWHEALIPLMEQEAGRAKEAEERKISERADDDVLLWGPYLQTLAPEKLSAVTIMAAMNCITTELPERDRGTPIATIVHSIGKAVEAESSAEIFARKRRDKNWRKSYLAQRAKDVVSSGSDLRSQGQLQKILRVQKSWIYERLQWTPTVKIRIGALLLSHLLDIAKVQVSRQDPKTGTELQEMQPVFFHTFHFSAGRRVGVVRLNTAVLESLSKGPVTSAIAKFLPMVAEPKPWVGYREGGFYEHSVSVIRLTSHDHQSRRYAITAAENGDLSQVFAALDVLGKTQWRINSFVFKVMLDGWNSEEAIAKIPPANPPSEKFEEPPPSAENGMRRKWLKDIREAENRRTGLKCQRCFQNFQLEIARAYLNETFYFPHNCDFRGRAYPMTPFFNHMGSDNMRGLLLFAQGKELTDSGLSWLKIHLANMYGYDKASFDERVQFTESHLPEIYDSVKEPLKGKRWWLSAEDPWQCLAACNELKAALDLPDPTRYVCQLAIHQDGTCNGLQHYAALGGDVAGAQQVNLEPGHRPSDIYTAVAEMIKAEIANEAAQGSALAQQLDGKVTRKVVKQTVMTNVYGVTFLGAVRQVFKQLVDMKASLPAWSTLTVQAAAPYIARKIFKCLSTMFNGAHDTQYWLTDCATRITDSISPEQADHIEREAKCETSPTKFKLKAVQGRKDELLSFRSSVVWTTPLKMPAVQPYRKPVKCRVLTNLQSITIEKRTIADPIHRAKQIQAFPPNFIHSLDATHMFLTALKCHEIGISFASIHDCFWTHPADVNTMNRIIRDAFIRMHSEDIVGRLAAEFKARYKGYMYLAKVYSRTPVARKILKWRRDVDPAKNGDVKARQRQELILERHRLALLASEDPREREQGEAMVTPATILAEAADEKALAPSDIKPATIGGMGPASSRSVKLNANQGLDVGDIANVRTVLSNDESKDLELDSTAKSGADADEMETPEETTLDIKEDDPLTEQTEPREKKALTRNRQDRHKTWVWMPLAFPPVPKKGDFDISRLKNSQYFFS